MARWLQPGEELLFHSPALWQGKRGDLHLTSRRVAWKGSDGTCADLVIPLNDVTGYRKSKDIREQEGHSPCMLQINTARAGLITLQLLAESQQPQGAFEARETFLRAAVPFLQRHKSPDDASVLVPVPQTSSTSSVASVTSPPVSAPVADAKDAPRAVDTQSDALVTMSAVGEISVHSPTPSSSGHVVYCVSFKYSKKGTLVTESAWHRYNDFFRLHQALQSHCPRGQSLAALPPKSWIQYYDTAVLEGRCQKLNDYMQACLAAHHHRHSACDALLVKFLTEGQRQVQTVDSQAAAAQGGLYGLTRKAIEKSDYYINATWTGREPTAQEDYERLRTRLRQWNIAPAAFPWRKRVVSLFGLTSAGKSSLLNHIFTVVCARAGGGQIDTTFTVVETLPQGDFAQVVKRDSFRTFTNDELSTPLPLSIDEVRTDPRYGQVFEYCDREALLRYEQLAEHEALLATYSKVRCVLVNEHYLRGSLDDIELAKRIIVIDSKGIDASLTRDLLDHGAKSDREAQQLATEVRLMQLFIKIADCVLFLLPYSELHNIHAQLALFELSLICSIDSRFYADRVKELNASTPRNGFLRDVVDALLEQPIELAKNLVAYLQPRTPPDDVVVGNERWTKVRFVVSKMDELHARHSGSSSNMRVEELQLFYTLGRAFGRALRYLEPPTMASFMLFGLPEKKREGQQQQSFTGDLVTFKQSMLRQARDESYEKRLDEAVIVMADQLGGEVAKMGLANTVNPLQWLWSDQQLSDQSKQRAKRRLQVL